MEMVAQTIDLPNGHGVDPAQFPQEKFNPMYRLLLPRIECTSAVLATQRGGLLMDQTSTPSASTGRLTEEVVKQAELLDEAKYYMLHIIVASMMRYHYLAASKKILLDSTLNPEAIDLKCYPDTFELQVVSSLLFMIALMGFYGESKEIAEEACRAGADSSAAKTDLILSGTIITVSLIRFVLLLKQNEEIETVSQTEGMEEVEEDLAIPT